MNEAARGFCNGDFEITKEYQAREPTGNSTGIGTGFGVGMGDIVLGSTNQTTAMYNFIEFKCK